MKKISEEWLKAAADDLSVIAKIISDGNQPLRMPKSFIPLPITYMN